MKLGSLREILNHISSKIGIKNYTDWYNISEEVIKINGGTRIITSAKGKGLSKIISSIIETTDDGQKIEWELWKFKHFQVPKNFWKDEKNQRKYMEYLQKEKGYKEYNDWYSISRNDFTSTGGSGILDIYDKSISKTVTSVFKEYKEWMIWKFKVVPKKFWMNSQNQKKYMDWIGKELGYSSIYHYYQIRKIDIEARGGSGLLKLYNYSPSAIVSAIYGNNLSNNKEEEIERDRDSNDSNSNSLREDIRIWDFRKVPNGFWKDKKNQRTFLEYIAKEEGIKTEEDWYLKFNSVKIKEYGGSSLLNIFSNSPSLLLSSIFPEFSWKPWLFQSSPKFNLLSSPEYFTNQSQSGSGSSIPKIIVDYIHDLSFKLKIEKLDDWYRVSRAQIDMIGGGNIIDRVGGLNNLLLIMYPHHNWAFKESSPSTPSDKPSKILNQRFKRASQRWLFISLQNLFPQLDMHEEFKIEDIDDKEVHVELSEEEDIELEIKNKQRKNMTIDVWIPKVKVAVEYQGEQHYKDIYIFGNKNTFIERDIQKKIECKRRGITIIEIPFWWDRSYSSLLATILHVRSDLRDYVSPLYLNQPISSIDVIPSSLPSSFLSFFQKNNQQKQQLKSIKVLQRISQKIPSVLINSSTLAISKLFSIPEDYFLFKSIYQSTSSFPKGWWMSPRPPGIRVLWDSGNKKIYSRNGKLIHVPSEFISHLESIKSPLNNIPLVIDGFLVTKDKKEDEVKRIIKLHSSGEWSKLLFIMFDIISLDSPLTERVEFLKSLVTERESLVETVECTSEDHMLEYFDKQKKDGNSEIYLRFPSSNYENGISNSFLFVRSTESTFVKVKGISHSGIICVQENGQEIVVRCSGDYLRNPPNIGELISVNHFGVFHSGKLKYPFVN